MRQLVFVEPGVVEWREADEPRILESADAIVRPLAVAACDLDIAAIRGRASIGSEYALGHEFVGESPKSVMKSVSGDREPA